MGWPTVYTIALQLARGWSVCVGVCMLLHFYVGLVDSDTYVHPPMSAHLPHWRKKDREQNRHGTGGNQWINMARGFCGLLPWLSQEDLDWLGSEDRPVFTLCAISWCLLALQSGQSVWIIASDLVACSLGHWAFLDNWQIYLTIFKKLLSFFIFNVAQKISFARIGCWWI